MLTAEPGTPDLDNVLHGIYELYADYVLKVGGVWFLWPSSCLGLDLAPLPSPSLPSQRAGQHPPTHPPTPPQNPFYEMDMPIRCELFQLAVERLIERNTRELRKARAGVDM